MMSVEATKLHRAVDAAEWGMKFIWLAISNTTFKEAINYSRDFHRILSEEGWENSGVREVTKAKTEPSGYRGIRYSVGVSFDFNDCKERELFTNVDQKTRRAIITFDLEEINRISYFLAKKGDI